VASGRLKASYEQASDGTYSPVGGWPALPNPFRTQVKPAS